jgi:parallel beta-helix repeat protein
MRARILLLAAAWLTSCVVHAATFTVINTNDSGVGSLRQALTDANASAGADTIAFAIPGAGLHVINVASFLPTIDEQVTIDGYTQPGAAVGTSAFPAPLNPVLQIQISGLQAQLVVNAGGAGTVIRGLVLNQSFEPIRVSASNVVITGNFIGTDAAGTTANGGSGFGIRHNSGDNLRIGGPVPADRNLISNMSQGGIILDVFSGSAGHLIQGNFIGTDRTGTVSLAQVSGVGLSNVNNAQVLNNLISGNPAGGLDTLNVTPNTLVIRGNLIGTQADGTSPLPNGNFGGINLRISNATVGGSGAGEPNTIAFNNGPGIWIRLNSNSNPLIQNVIYGNTQQGITLQNSVPGTPLPNDAGDADAVPGNRGQNYPVLNVPVISAGSATISGTLNSQASRSYRIEFFANAACGSTGFGQGQTFIGNTTVVTDGSGNATIGPIVFAVPAGQSVITATATDLTTNDTSEFSQCPAAGPATTTGVVSSLNPSTFGQSVTFTATVSGGTSPTGTVQFLDGATSLGTVALAGNTAALTTSALAVGTHPITAVYSGDVDDTSSTSAPVSQVVNAAAPGATATSLVSSLNPSTVGQAVTFTATVSGGTSPTGNVQFREGATVLATVPLAGATAAFTTSALSAGVHVITADYAGDVDDSPSTSPPVSQVVNGGGGGPQPPSGVKPIPVLPWPLLGVLAVLLGWLGVRRK